MRDNYWHTTQLNLVNDFAVNKVSGIYDIVVVGGGFAGLSTALHLSEYGCRVLVAEQYNLGAGASTSSAGFLSNLPLKAIFQCIGSIPDSLQKFHHESLHYLLSMIKSYNIECNLTKNGLIVLSNDSIMSSGHSNIENIRNETSISGFKHAYLKKKAYSINPVQCLQGLVYQLGMHSVTILENFCVSDVSNNNRVFTITNQKGISVKAKRIVFACGAEMNLENSLLKSAHRTLFPINSGVIVTERLSQSVRKKISNNNRIFITKGRYINYFRLTPDKRLLFGGKQNIQNDNKEQNYHYLCNKLHDFFPFLEEVTIDFHWQKPLAFNYSGVPIIKEIKDNIWVINGFGGSGIANSIYSGLLLAQSIVHNQTSHSIFGIKHPSLPQIVQSDVMRRIIGILIN